MKSFLGVLTVLVVPVLVACGGLEPVEAPELEQQSSALVTCSQTCPDGSTVSCEGNTCSVQADSVECDGFYNICLPSTPICGLNNRCSRLAGTPCSPVGGSRSCCLPGHPNPNCFCTPLGVWACSAL
ncbi:hypothetical protein HI113_09300 [Corallococcus exiguus]|uniref:hypothetical protein n=1 Tax=Corallococcus exiguus TaxID=83462 RepID=UPI000EE4FDFB|nr:hypothetical protein [Corallococcus exiguus]NNB94099.1 hypothetical protein [Corallococcus exiguus]NPC46188.1 hypothetical protein [Corallococcus exiguus]RKH86029.1 hypothetical protein D7X99_04565 [Corallococcus sp. AB032C]